MNEQLQVLVSIIRLPRMCTEFHKAMRKKGQDIQKQTEAKAVATLYSRIQGQDLAGFMEKVLAKIEKRRELPTHRTDSTNAIAIKGMLKDIIKQGQT